MSKKTLYAFIISFLLLIAVIVLNRYSFNAMRNYSEEVDHTRQVISQFVRISDHLKSAQIYSPVYDSIPEKDFYKLYRNEAIGIRSELTQLRQLVNDNEKQVLLVDSLTKMVHAEMDVLLSKNIAEIIQSGEGWRLKNLLTIHQMINRGKAEEEVLLFARKASLLQSSRFTTLLTTAFGVIAVGIIIITFISNLFIANKRKWLEGFLESILDTSQNGVVHYKAVREKGKIYDFRIEFANKAVDNLLGITATELTGKRLSEFSAHDRETQLLHKYIDVVETGTPVSFEYLYKRNSIEKWMLVSVSKLDDGVIASFHEISQLKKYEAELKENIKGLERSNKELEQYAYVASHDLQEPLRKIRSFGSYLQDTQAHKLDEKGQQQLGKIMSAAERMSSLIKDILSFSSLRKQALFEDVDLNKVLASVVQDLDLMINQKQAVINNDPLPVIEAIPLQMTQLFYNLINNSLKFSKTDSPVKIQISCRRLHKNEKKPGMMTSHYYEIIFKDNGIGFENDYVEQIFGLFKRLNDKQSYPGSGIGLSLCKKVVDNHHGEIRASGKEGEGAEFFVYLPAKQV